MSTNRFYRTCKYCKQYEEHAVRRNRLAYYITCLSCGRKTYIFVMMSEGQPVLTQVPSTLNLKELRN